MSTETVEGLISSSYGLNPRQRVNTLVRAVELADSQGDLDAGFEAREELVYASYYVPGGVELVSAFSWLLARHDEDPERFYLNLWSYKWVVHALPSMLAVSLEQIEEVMADVETRFEASGEGPAVAAKLRMIIAEMTGEVDDVRTYMTIWREALEKRRGWLNDCGACDESSYVDALLMIGEEQQALAEGKNLIEGRSTCSTEPHFTLGTLLATARRIGPDGLATDMRKRGYRLIRDDPKFYSLVAKYVRDSLTTGDLNRSAELIAKHRSWGEVPQDELSHYIFTSAARRTLLRFEHIGKPIPNGLADTKANGKSADAVAKDLIAEAERLGAAFDARNGNSYYTDNLEADRVFATR